MNNLLIALASAGCISFAGAAVAGQVFTMTFDGIPKAVAGPGQPAPPDQTFGSAVLGFYNGDPIYQRVGSEPWKTAFDINALSICPRTSAQGCQGTPPASPGGGSYVGSVTSASFEFVLTGPELFLSDLSFLYYLAAQNANARVELFSGVNEIVEIALVCPPTACGWLEFKGLGAPLGADKGVTRVRFSSTENSAVFDNMRVTTTGGTSVPEPSTYALMATGLALLAWVRRRRATH
jgi:hypothetical protein